MELFAVLDVLIHIFHDIFRKRRSEKAAVAEGAMAELGRTLAPGDDFAAIELLADFAVELVVARHIAIDDFAVVEDGFDFLRSGFGAKGECGEWRAAGVAGKFFAREKAGAEGGPGVSGNGLDVDTVETAAKFECAHEQHVQKNTTGEAEEVCCGGFTKILGERDDEFFERVLRASRDI